MLFKQTLFASTLVALSHATSFPVSVGEGGSLDFSPSTIDAQIGDTVVFTFHGNHGVVQADFNSPCQPLQGGFSVPSQSTNGATFTINVTDSNPTWFYCPVANHCEAGMVGTINPGSSGHDQADFASAAASASGGQQPTAVSGGQLVVGTSTTGSLGPAKTGSSTSTTGTAKTTSSTSTSSTSSTSKGAAAATYGAGSGLLALAAGLAAVF